MGGHDSESRATMSQRRGRLVVGAAWQTILSDRLLLTHRHSGKIGLTGSDGVDLRFVGSKYRSLPDLRLPTLLSLHGQRAFDQLVTTALITSNGPLRSLFKFTQSTNLRPHGYFHARPSEVSRLRRKTLTRS